MRTLLFLVFLAIGISGCNSMPHPHTEKEPAPEVGTRAPNGEASPWAQ